MGSDTTGLAPCLNAHPNEGLPLTASVLPTHSLPLPHVHSQVPMPSHLLIICLQKPGRAQDLSPHSFYRTPPKARAYCCNYVQSQQELLWEGGGRGDPQSKNLSIRVPSFWGFPGQLKPCQGPSITYGPGFTLCPITSRAPILPLHAMKILQ